MGNTKKLKKLGIIPQEKVKFEEKNNIAKTIAEKLSNNINQLSNNYNDLYMRMFNCEMYYADIPKEFCGVFYFYKDNTIYIEKGKQVDNYLISESIHYLQNFSKFNKKDNQVGICKFQEFNIFGLGINEAIVQYITILAMQEKFQRVNNDKISIYTNDDVKYKYMVSLINQIMFLIDDNYAIESCINSTENFEDNLYNTFEENTQKIVKNFDAILTENGSCTRNEEKIINIYMQTQELIYKTYFSKTYKLIETTEEEDLQVKKMVEFENIIGKYLDGSDNVFEEFKNDMNSKYLKKYVEISNRKNLPMKAERYKIHRLFNKILQFFKKEKAN